MYKFKSINLLDKIFITVSIFLIVYAWINFFIRDLTSTFFLSLIFTFSIVFIIFSLHNKRQTKKEKVKAYIKEVNEKFLAFRLLRKSEQLLLLEKILKHKYTTRIVGDSIIYKHDQKTYKTIIATHLEKVSDFDLINLLQGIKNINCVEIICNDFDPNLNLKILNGIEIKFITKKVLFDEFFSPVDIYPNCEILNKKIERKKLKDITRNMFQPTRSKSYFLSGLILIFSSIILPFHIYYLIFGSALLIFSIVCKIRPVFSR